MPSDQGSIAAERIPFQQANFGSYRKSAWARWSATHRFSRFPRRIAVTINASPDYEGQASYSFDVTATDAVGNATTHSFTYGIQAGDAAGNWSTATNISLNVTTQTVALTINNRDEDAPSYTSATSASVNESSRGGGGRSRGPISTLGTKANLRN